MESFGPRLLILCSFALGCDFTRFETIADGGAPLTSSTGPVEEPPPEPSSSTIGPAPTTDPSSEPDVTLPPIECDAPSADHVRAYFEVPGASGAEEGDYFRLPFPNDFYLNGSELSLGEFPRITAISSKFVDTVNAVSDGFSASPTLLFRFSGRVNFKDSVIPRFHVLDITDPAAPSSPPLKLLFSPKSGKYICHDWLAARPAPGHALLGGHTYAAWLDKGVLAENGSEVEPPPHFAAMLSDTPPRDPVLATLHVKYEPLREHLAAGGIDPSTLLTGTVFTVGQVRSPMRELATAALALPTPAVSGWVRCEPGAVSPCADVSADRACGATTAQYEEYHALIELPIFQQGDAPYFGSGGEIDSSNVVRSEQVCASLTVPIGPAPEGGFPVLVAAHGAGGSFRSAVRTSVAGLLSTTATPAGGTQRFAVLGYDGVQHGPRRGTGANSELDPDLLLFNFVNPEGTLGTSLQGGVDVLSVARAARTLVLPAEISGRPDVAFNGKVLFWGHSQGAMQGAIALPYSDDVDAAVFTGLGAGFLQTMLLRQEPALIPDAVRQAVADPGDDGELVFGAEYHPALALVQQLVDPADPLHHAALLLSQSESNPLHVFQVYGKNDAFSPGIAQKSFTIAAKLGVAAPDISAEPADDLGAVDPVFPLSGNVVLGDVAFTAGVREYGPPTGNNGHFVAYDVPAAGQDIATFLAMCAAGETPAIGH